MLLPGKKCLCTNEKPHSTAEALLSHSPSFLTHGKALSRSAPLHPCRPLLFRKTCMITWRALPASPSFLPHTCAFRRQSPSPHPLAAAATIYQRGRFVLTHPSPPLCRRPGSVLVRSPRLCRTARIHTFASSTVGAVTGTLVLKKLFRQQKKKKMMSLCPFLARATSRTIIPPKHTSPHTRLLHPFH